MINEPAKKPALPLARSAKRKSEPEKSWKKKEGMQGAAKKRTMPQSFF